MDTDYLLGRVVYSTAGRDEGKLFIVLGIVDESYVLVADGKLRTEEKPKKKKLKHLALTNTVADEIKGIIFSGKSVSNSMIRKFLQLNDDDKEV